MTESKPEFFLSLGGAFLLGLISIIAAVLILLLLLPYIIEIVIVSMLLFFIFILIWAVVYVAMVIGVAIYYAIRHPMKISTEKKQYTISRAKEAGRRKKGKT
jgi:membrane protein implicated in regulation of membrane protease activity